VMVATSDGVLSVDRQPMARLSVSALARRDGEEPQRGHAGGGGRVELSFFLNEKTPEHFALEAAREAIAMLDAVEAPAGEMTVVLGPGWPGILLHEAVGHGLEADFNRKKVSAFSDRIGQLVASPLCTVVDDGTIRSRRGSLNVDDEGQPTGRNVLIENGVLRGYLQDKLSSRVTGAAPTGSGRRESYAHIPMPRMTNTFMMAGESDPADIIRSVPKGLYCANFGGGQVDITSGNFVFSASESYLIEDGKLGRPVRNATLIGNGPEALKFVSMVGNDLRLDEGIGTCGKEGQSVPVGVGIPTIKIDKMTVGGTA
jgi:TldD protein